MHPGGPDNDGEPANLLPAARGLPPDAAHLAGNAAAAGNALNAAVAPVSFAAASNQPS